MTSSAWTLLAWIAASGLPGGEPSANTSPTTTGIDGILTRLEHRSDSLKDIRCRVVFVEDDRINLTQRKKYGQILFMMTESNPHFLIYFERTEMDGLLGKQEWYLFDGHWLYEAIERLKQVTKREITRPGESIDLFDLETAPFPLPFGQKKAIILKNFDVTLVPPAEGDPANTDHLVCMPKPDSRMHGKYDKLEFFIRKDIHLPSRVVVTKNGGLEINSADFPDLSVKSINAGVTKRDFKRPAAWKRYTEVLEELAPAD